MTETVRWLKLFVGSKNDRAPEVYDLLSTNNNLGEKTLYLNLGYWDGATTYDAACQRLAEVLGEAAGLAAGQRVLDCGFGFADQDLYWLERFAPASIDGVNISAPQVAVARRRVAAAGAESRIKLHHASATKLPFPDASFDRVLALDTGLHCDTREEFFREAHRVLRPGGRIAMTDVVPLDRRPGLLQKISQGFCVAFWQIPRINMYPRAEYERKLRAAGFAKVSVQSIGEHIYAPFGQYAKIRLREPEVRSRMNPLVRWGWIMSVGPMADMNLDYVLAVAEKPE